MQSSLKSLIPGPVRAAIAHHRLNKLAQAPEYARFGQEMLHGLIDLTGVTPASRILEIGCGPGRLVSALQNYLTPAGSYEGIDILKGEIDWCRATYSARHENIRFQHADLFNQYYNSSGTVKARDYAFPFPADSFDCVYMQSVFTHMLRDEMEQYVKETARVLKPGARGVITYYLVETPDFPGGNDYFPHALDGCQVHDLKYPEWAVAFREDDVRGVYASHGLRVIEPIQYGRKAGEADKGHPQDIVTAEKASS